MAKIVEIGGEDVIKELMKDMSGSMGTYSNDEDYE